MALEIRVEQNNFVFEEVFDIVLYVRSTNGGKVFFFVESLRHFGIDIPPFVVVKPNEETSVKMRVYGDGEYLVYAKKSEEGSWIESNRIYLTINAKDKIVKEHEEEVKKEKDGVVPEDVLKRPAMFWGDKEKSFQKQVATELVERVVNEYVLYFPIRVDNYHPLYGESIVKFYDDPLRLPCIVEWKGTENKNEKFSVDNLPSIIVHVLKRRVEEDLKLNIVVGDFIQYGRDFYEIVAVEAPTKLFYSFNMYVELNLTCVKARNSVFFLESKEE